MFEDSHCEWVIPWPLPSAPTNLTATTIGPSQINLAWTAASVPPPDALTRYYIYQGGNLIASVDPLTLTFQVKGLQSLTTYSFNVAAVGGHGNIGPQSNTATAGTTGAASGTPNFPLVAIVAVGGDQSYGQAGTSGFVSYTASGPGTAAYTAVQQLGSYDIVFGLSGSYEGWQASGRNKQNLVQAIKGLGTYPNVKNASRGTLCFLYGIMESSQNVASGAPYQTLTNLIRANNWWTYETPGGTGTILPSPNAAFSEVNYTYAWNTAAGAASLDSSICGHVYGTLSNGQGPAQTAANYFASALLTTNVLDSRFTGLTNGAAPNADGIFLDNCFIFPNGGGNVGSTTASWDGINTQTNSTIAAYPSGASSLLSRGQYHFFLQLQTYLSQCNPGSTYYNIGNFGNYANNIGYGNIHGATAAAMDNTFHGGLVENVAGVPGSGWQTFMTFADVLANYNYGMAYTQAPHLLGLGVHLPASDGSLSVTFVTGGVATTVAANTALEYQMMRCMLCLTLLGNGYFAVGVNNYNYALDRWYDEYGDDSQTQVNVKRGYLGQPIGGTPTAASFALGPLGIWSRQFDNGIAIMNPWGNGAQTLTTTQLAGTWFFLKGTQQPSVNSGNQFSSFTFADGDGLILVKTGTIAPLTITNANPLVPQATTGSAYGKTMNATGGVPPYTWSLVSASPDSGGWLSITPGGVLGGTPTTPETESIVIKVTDSASPANSFTSNPYTLVVNNSVALAITTTSPLPAATEGVAYSPPLMSATGGTPPYTWSITSVTPDTGSWLSISASGQLSGTPPKAETESVTIRVDDSASHNASAVFSLVVNSNLQITSASPLPQATVGSAYSDTLAASGGTPPYSWSMPSASPNTGGWLSCSSTGVLAGTPTTAETESVSIQIVDSVPTTVTKSFSLPVAAAGSTIYLQEDYNTYPAGNVTSITSAFSSKGYSSATFTNAGDLAVLARSSMPAALLADSRFPAGKTKIFLFNLPAIDVESRMTWTGFPNSTTRDVSWSWWEFRPNGNNGGEKFARMGNYVGGTIGGNRGIDAIIGMGLPAGTLTLFSNSANMHSFPDQPFGTFPWTSGGLHHFERVDHLPTDTSSTYSCSLYIDGNLQGSASGLQIYDNATEAAVGWQLWDFGGWASGSGTFPIQRYICAARIANVRQGVWSMSAI